MHENFNSNNKVSLSQIWKTIHADLIGKDSHRGITLTYGWLANQMGHYALGFIPATVLHFLAFSPWESFLYVAIFWFIFEVYNALSPLYKSEYRGNGTFKPAWGNLTFDTFTDLCFFWLGSLTIYMIIDKSNVGIIWMIALMVFLFFSSRYWFLTKLYQQNAFFPYQFRLSQWNGNLRNEDAQVIKSFLRFPDQPKHFVVFGEPKSGKTTISVGLGNEMSIRHKKTTYTTLNKWIEKTASERSDTSGRTLGLWSWMESDFVIIDDINPGIPKEANMISANDIKRFIHKSSFAKRNISLISAKSIVWVVGTNSSNDTTESWQNLLIDFGVNETNIHIILLKNA
jgi:hypothetical protein